MLGDYLTAKGRMLLIYSDLSEKIGLQKEGRIDTLCQEYGLRVQSSSDIPFLNNRSLEEGKPDPLLSVKRESKVILYEIVKV